MLSDLTTSSNNCCTFGREDILETSSSCLSFKLYLFLNSFLNVLVISSCCILVLFLNRFGNNLFNVAPPTFCTPNAAGDNKPPAIAEIPTCFPDTSPSLANPLNVASVTPTPAPKPPSAIPPLPTSFHICAALAQGINKYNGSEIITAALPPHTEASLSYCPVFAHGNFL